MLPVLTSTSTRSTFAPQRRAALAVETNVMGRSRPFRFGQTQPFVGQMQSRGSRGHGSRVASCGGTFDLRLKGSYCRSLRQEISI